MVIQNFLFPDEVCKAQELYFRTTGTANRTAEGITLLAGEALQTDTYMNALDIGYWKKYTNLENVILELQIQGDFKILIEVLENREENRIVYEHEYHLESAKTICINIPEEIRLSLIHI